jgi:hypothetical protein
MQANSVFRSLLYSSSSLTAVVNLNFSSFFAGLDVFLEGLVDLPPFFVGWPDSGCFPLEGVGVVEGGAEKKSKMQHARLSTWCKTHL